MYKIGSYKIRRNLCDTLFRAAVTVQKDDPSKVTVTVRVRKAAVLVLISCRMAYNGIDAHFFKLNENPQWVNTFLAGWLETRTW